MASSVMVTASGVSPFSSKRGVDRAELVRRHDEQDTREIDVDLEIVIAERVVLRRVQHLEQRCGRIALESARGDLVDLVEHELRVGHLLLRRRLDLGFHFEQRDFAAERRRHGLQLGRQAVVFQDLLFLLRLHVERAREQIREAQRIVDAGDQPAPERVTRSPCARISPSTIT